MKVTETNTADVAHEKDKDAETETEAAPITDKSPTPEAVNTIEAEVETSDKTSESSSLALSKPATMMESFLRETLCIEPCSGGGIESKHRD